jgi:hypothetical protein
VEADQTSERHLPQNKTEENIRDEKGTEFRNPRFGANIMHDSNYTATEIRSCICLQATGTLFNDME